MKHTKYLKEGDQIKNVILGQGQCYASDRITVDGQTIGVMYREEPDDANDSGWRFLAGDEEEAYLDNPEYIGRFDLNTIANYDASILPYLNAAFGCEWERVPNENTFVEVL